ncbi:GntR domain protein (plasmid) [Pseudonocardia dioxanivorans CB1190]|jgi:DNA-binding FadR family transcriptional regulator|uniref:GntR domain protein n=1 Tax=Pseudonocardia dioxanivorans (strain ATCC 55486 / DSM 44775 / JCM 13855 / CB1190) TaxID=675635 RepID=F2L6U0_PSEUX|nr:FadR/GntR family transcriptional regulator [Pseudonocardia dioxanivorans]AEA28812.1 GntR domain protein [Pseudonocardia dioxanivorans CB1190]GJF03544.1 GntR family transcriptional regulator [Pseudonocardia sp. D17]
MAGHVTGDAAPAATGRKVHLRVQRIRPAYQQIADELRTQIVSGQLGSGDRLPSEPELCKAFGVSRSTIREALRVLASQNLVETRRGATGGSFVSTPDPERSVAALGASLGILVDTPRLHLDDLLEARLLLEPMAARLAAERADTDTISAVLAAADSPRQPSDPRSFSGHFDFHSTILMATGNLLFTMMGQPVADVLRTRLHRAEVVSSAEWDQANESHRVIAQHIAAGDPAAAEQEMRNHLNDLRPLYQRAGSW